MRKIQSSIEQTFEKNNFLGIYCFTFYNLVEDAEEVQVHD